MTADIAVFLAERIDEEERLAQAALDEVSWYEPVIARPDMGYAKLPTEPERRWELDREAELGVYVNGDWQCVGYGPAAHIARQDPRAALDRVAALRALVAMHENDRGDCMACSPEHGAVGDVNSTAWPCPTLRALASAYRRHPEFDEAWATEVRA